MLGRSTGRLRRNYRLRLFSRQLLYPAVDDFSILLQKKASE
jgi:hypothetical protein